MSHPTSEIDDTIHQRVRLGILAVLTEASRADFNYLLDALSLSEGNLSRHLQVLEGAGHVKTQKVFEAKRPRTWVSLTKQGRRALDSELQALRALIDRVNGDSRPV